MNVLLLSEHYAPKISGTVAYVKQLLAALPNAEFNIYFLCPAQGELGEIKEQFDEESGVTFLNLGVNQKDAPIYSPKERTALCEYVQQELPALVEKYQIEVVHLLYGFFLAEILDTDYLRSKGIKSFFTVHNIPPEECSISWSGDVFWRKWKDDLRKIGVKWINRKRLKKQHFDTYLVPSDEVKNNLKSLLPAATIVVTPHGGAELITPQYSREKKVGEKLKILTVGGIIPHKRQAWIPEIAAYLKKQGMVLKWNIIGPKRNLNYVKYVEKQIEKEGVTAEVRLLGAVSSAELEKFYQTSHLYLQLSSEEGFCMTVLDAIAYGLPTMATPVGAIPEMLDTVEGIVLDPHLNQLKKVIAHYILILEDWQPSKANIEKFQQEYSWEKSAQIVREAYGT